MLSPAAASQQAWWGSLFGRWKKCLTVKFSIPYPPRCFPEQLKLSWAFTCRRRVIFCWTTTTNCLWACWILFRCNLWWQHLPTRNASRANYYKSCCCSVKKTANNNTRFQCIHPFKLPLLNKQMVSNRSRRPFVLLHTSLLDASTRYLPTGNLLAQILTFTKTDLSLKKIPERRPDTSRL